MKPTLFVLLTFFALYSCQKDEMTVLSGNDDLVGTWVKPEYNDTLITYSKANNLIANEPGYTFKTGNTLICRQNSGWCGTPPITTADYEGTWSWNDSIVTINTSYWGGKVEFSLKVISLTYQKLFISVAKAEYQGGN